MVCHYKPQLGVKCRKRYEKDDIMKAVDDVNTGMPIRAASKKHGIPKSVINRHQKAPRTSKTGHPTVLGQEVEDMLVKHLLTCSEWGYPMDSWDLRLIVKGYLDRRGVTVKLFKDNLPGKDWVASFLRRQQDILEASGGNWKWPRKDDVIWYPFSDIVQKIAEPKYLTRGIMEVKELKETYT